MTRALPPVAAALLLAVAACDVVAPMGCPGWAKPGIVVEIYDGVTGAPRAEGALGLAEDGAFRDTLVPYESDSAGLYSLQGALERPGTYDVFISHEGYRSWARTGVEVEEGTCGVEIRELRAELVPASAP